MVAFAPTAPGRVFDQLAHKKLLIVSGKGGVGRTTVSALLGLELAARGKRVLVATTGHDDRLAWMLGASALSDVAVPRGERLWIQRLEPSRCVREYGAMMLRSRRLSEAVFGNRLVDRLLHAIPGFDDYAVLGKSWHEAIRSGHYDCVVFDGPASGHLRLNLGVPGALVETVPRGPLVDEAAQVQAALRDPEKSAAVLVGLPETWPLSELSELTTALQEEIGLSVGALVVNKRWPRGLAALGDPDPDASVTLREAVDTLDKLRERGEEQAAVVEAWRNAASGQRRPMINLPFWGAGLDDPEAFDGLRARLEGGES